MTSRIHGAGNRQRPKRKPRTKKDIIAYLTGHFRYHTMNTCNHSTSYARCVKVTRLDFPDKATEDVAWEVTCADNRLPVHDDVNDVLAEFDERHDYRWQIAWNGRSNGYLVLIHGGRHNDGRVFMQPGLNLDMHEDFEEWSLSDLRDRLELIWDFDETVERAIEVFVDFCTHNKVVDEQIMVPRTIKTAVPR